MERAWSRKNRVWKVWRAIGESSENLQNAGDQLEEVMGKRTRAIERKLRQVEALPTEESQKMLNLPDLMEDEDD